MALNIIDIPLVPPGHETVATREDFAKNKSIFAASAAEYTRLANTPDEIRRRFLESPPLLFRKELPSKAVVETIHPSGAYSDRAALVIAIRPEIVSKEPVAEVNGRIPTLTIYDFPQDARLEYFTQIMGTLGAVQDEVLEHKKGEYTVLFTENSALKVSDEEHRVARTIAEPHTQIWAADREAKPLEEDARVPKLLRHERHVISLLESEIEANIGGLTDDLKDHGASFIPHLRNAPPNGYVLETNIGRSTPASEQGVMLEAILSAHHKRYGEVAKKLAAKLEESNQYLNSLLLPQPSYKVFGTFNEQGKLEISIAPTIFAGTGVVEALDREIERKSGPDVPTFFKDEHEESAYYDRISKKLESI